MIIVVALLSFVGLFFFFFLTSSRSTKQPWEEGTVLIILDDGSEACRDLVRSRSSNKCITQEGPEPNNKVHSPLYCSTCLRFICVFQQWHSKHLPIYPILDLLSTYLPFNWCLVSQSVVWGQWHWDHLGTCEKCRNMGQNQTCQIRICILTRSPRIHMHSKCEKHWSPGLLTQPPVLILSWGTVVPCSTLPSKHGSGCPVYQNHTETVLYWTKLCVWF